MREAVMEFRDGCRFEFHMNDAGAPPQKLADVTLFFTQPPFKGLKLDGFSIWTREGDDKRARAQAVSEVNPRGLVQTQTIPKGDKVFFPSRTYRVNGYQRSHLFLKAASDHADDAKVADDLCAAILEAFETHTKRLGLLPATAAR